MAVIAVGVIAVVVIDVVQNFVFVVHLMDAFYFGCLTIVNVVIIVVMSKFLIQDIFTTADNAIKLLEDPNDLYYLNFPI